MPSYLSEAESRDLRELLGSSPDSPAVQTWPDGQAYRVYPYPPPTDFPAPVRDWLTQHGFQRDVDRNTGPVYTR